ncbi:unnamed protein product, partial [Coregonus sp. 'balchen']
MFLHTKNDLIQIKTHRCLCSACTVRFRASIYLTARISRASPGGTQMKCSLSLEDIDIVRVCCSSAAEEETNGDPGMRVDGSLGCHGKKDNTFPDKPKQRLRRMQRVFKLERRFEQQRYISAPERGTTSPIILSLLPLKSKSGFKRGGTSASRKDKSLELAGYPPSPRVAVPAL